MSIVERIGNAERTGIVVLGMKQHGKDTFCEHLRDTFGVTFASTSRFMCDNGLFEQLKDSHGYATADACFNDRDNHRQLWYNEINRYCTPDGARLIREIFAVKDICCGPRHRVEFDLAKAEGLVNFVIWIDADERLPSEANDSMTLTKADADVILTNNSTEADFLRAIEAFYHKVLHQKLAQHIH